MNSFTFAHCIPSLTKSSASLVKHILEPRKRGCLFLLLIDEEFVTVTDPFLLRLT